MAIVYSFSWAQNPKWSQPFPSGPEIVQYLYDVCEKFGILDKIQLNTDVKGIRWVEEDEEWEATLVHLAVGVGDLSSDERETLEKEKGLGAVCLRTETVRAKVVCSAAGGLVEPKPNVQVPGIETFEGPIIHTARWDPTVSFKDKDVVVLGTGCSAAQVVPQLIKPEFGAKSITQLLRTPPWVQPVFTKEQKEVWNSWMPWLCTYIPGFQNAIRKLLMGVGELEFISIFKSDEKSRQKRKRFEAKLLAHMKKLVPEEYHEILTPDFDFGCKRRVIDEGYYESFQDPRISITSLPLTAAGPKTVTLGPGRHYPPMSKVDSKAPTEQKTIPADILIMANGYATNEWLHPLAVYGRDGRSLAEVWRERGGAQAYLGTAMDGFPNFFLIFGPNTATGHTSVILASENMVEYTLRLIRPVLVDREVRTVEVKESAQRRWTEGVQRDLKNTVFATGGCSSWYFDRRTGWNASVYPRSQIEFSLRYMFPRWSHWHFTYTRKGLLMWRLRLIFRSFAALVLLTALLWSIKNGRAAVSAQITAWTGRARGLLRHGLDFLRARV